MNKASLFYLYLSAGLALLSGLFNFYLFEKLFSTVPVFVSGLAAFLVAALMYGLLWRIEDKDNHLVWILCAKISVITTVGAIFISQVASANAQETVQAHKTAKEYMESALAEDAAAQEVWIGNNRITHAAKERQVMEGRIASYVDGAKELEHSRNGDALMAESLDRIPAGGGLAFLVVLSLLLAVVLDLGAAKAVKIYRDMIREDSKSIKKDRKISIARADTGTAPGFNKRYTEFKEALTAGEVDPTIRSIKDVFQCAYPVASRYLSQACEDGLLTCRINSNGRKVYKHG